MKARRQLMESYLYRVKGLIANFCRETSFLFMKKTSAFPPGGLYPGLCLSPWISQGSVPQNFLSWIMPCSWIYFHPTYICCVLNISGVAMVSNTHFSSQQNIGAERLPCKGGKRQAWSYHTSRLFPTMWSQITSQSLYFPYLSNGIIISISQVCRGDCMD